MNYTLKSPVVVGLVCKMRVERFLHKEYKQGDVLTFNEGVTYSLIIGAPANVKITYKGEDYPLKVDGRVARFKLPQ